jgi:DNA-directed RNA polymerase specialized sigma subunit
LIEFDKLVKSSNRLQELVKVLNQEMKEMQMLLVNLPRVQEIAQQLNFDELIGLGIKFFTGSIGNLVKLLSQSKKRDHLKLLLFVSS